MPALKSSKTMNFSHVFTKSNEGSIDDTYSFDHNPLGEGSYGVVTIGKHKVTGQTRAVKAIDLGKIANPERFQDEINIQQNLVHPNIVRLFEVFKDYKKVYLVMELCTGGELFDRIVAAAEQAESDGHAFSEKDAAVYMRQIMRAISYLHSQHYVHRDIKPENFLLEHPGKDAEIKVIDFGLAKMYDCNKDQPMQTKAGTPFYVSPQVLAGKYTEKCDIWSCGVILYILLCGYPPFYGERDQDILKMVKKGKFAFPSPDWDDSTPKVKDLIVKMLAYEPDQRPSASDVMAHPWFDNMESSLESAVIKVDFAKKLKDFRGVARLKKVALTLIASQMNSDEVRDLRATFEAMDANQDGTLTVQEITEGMEKHKLEVPSEIKEAISRMDSDGSGSIDYTEFLAATMSRQQYLKKEVLWAAFRQFDKDGDGQIDKDELKEMLNQNEDCEAIAKIMIKEVDVDGDGKLSFEEFSAMMS